MVLDVTERLALEREVAEAVGHEQDRLGMELHDGLGQELTGLAISLESLVRQADAGGHPLRRDLRELSGLASQSVSMCRQIAQGLAPMQLARGGLRNALRSLAASARSVHGVRLRCRVRGLGEQDLPSNIAHQFYRISQEAISNAIRHGNATQIDLSVIRDGDRLQLLVRDNGRGMPESPAADGMGLHTMRYRAKMIGAELDVGPAAGSGVRVRCSLRLGGAAADPR
jgi:signal transduction histidine kinase